MTQLGHLLQEFLDLTGWKGDVHAEEGGDVCRLETGAMVDDQSCRVHATTVDSLDSIAIFVFPPFRVRQAKYAEACKLVNAINYQTAHGRLEIDPTDGELRYRDSADVEFCEPSAPFIRSMVLFGGAFLTKWMPALAEVAMTARGADEILERLQEDGEGATETVAADATEVSVQRGSGAVTLH